MKSVLLVNHFPEVSETFLVRQASFMKTTVVARTIRTDNFGFYDFDYADVISLSRPADNNVILKLVNRILKRPISLWTSKERERFKSILLDRKIKVVIAAFGPNGINALQACKELGIPLIVEFLGYDASALMRNSWYRKRIKKVLEYASAAVVLYDGMQLIFKEFGFQSDKIQVINVGVPVNCYEPRPRRTGDVTNFLFVGRFVEKKGPLETILAFLNCAEQNSNVHLKLVGDGPLMSRARALVDHSNHKDKIMFTGLLSQKELKPLYKTSDVFVQHSVVAADGNSEGWPVSVAEACASGLTVVSTKHAGIPSQVDHGRTGFLVEEHDIEGMSKYMLQLSNNKDLCYQMGRNAREHISKVGNMETQLEKLNSLVLEVVK